MEICEAGILACSEERLARVPLDDQWLHPNEAARLAGMRFPKRRADFRLGRWTAKRALMEYLHLAVLLQAIEIRAAADGAPEPWIFGEPAPAVISISHRAGRGLCAVATSGTALGCDLELIEPRSDAFVADYFTPEEQRIAKGAPDKQALLWSAKESALKALRVGLRMDTRSLFVHLSDPPALAVHCDTGRIFHGWWHIEGPWVRTVVSDPYYSL